MFVLDGSSYCGNLDLRSFLLLPMQRVTKYPLLLDAAFRKTVEGTSEFKTLQKALQLATKLATECNETIRKFERIEQLVELENKFLYEVK